MLTHCRRGDVRGQRVEGHGEKERDLGRRLVLVQRIGVGAWHCVFVRYLGIDARPGDMGIFI